MDSHQHLPEALSDSIVAEVTHGTSDLHFEPSAEHYRLRARRLGKLVDVAQWPLFKGEQFVAALKNAARVDVTNRRVPQDGRFQLQSANLTLDCRLNSLPTLFGEKVVLRLFSDSNDRWTLTQLGLLPDQLTLVQETLKVPDGLILVTGPTGSGKTRSLYAMLQYLNHPQVNISTIEDPIEVPLPGINQTAATGHTELSFAACLRALLRQDPDVLMVGEIRDEETAEMTVRAAHTGHLVLATLHAGTPMAALIRLEQLGVRYAELAGCLRLVMNQRLVTLHDKRWGVFDLIPIQVQARRALLQPVGAGNFWLELDGIFSPAKPQPAQAL
ncbi:MAG: Flp pilus assembly complex ATPase component TadA [Idiomarina sp.]|nr:Flp pilus assembly complex ATPase component TadA [Idiomarina sp.]